MFCAHKKAFNFSVFNRIKEAYEINSTKFKQALRNANYATLQD